MTSNDSPEERDLRRVGSNPNFRYPLAGSNEVARGRMLGVSFAGDPIVLARTEGGSLFALGDRCPQRQVPLHLGVISGEELKFRTHVFDRPRFLVVLADLLRNTRRQGARW